MATLAGVFLCILANSIQRSSIQSDLRVLERSGGVHRRPSARVCTILHRLNFVLYLVIENLRGDVQSASACAHMMRDINGSKSSDGSLAGGCHLETARSHASPTMLAVKRYASRTVPPCVNELGGLAGRGLGFLQLRIKVRRRQVEAMWCYERCKQRRLHRG